MPFRKSLPFSPREAYCDPLVTKGRMAPLIGSILKSKWFWLIVLASIAAFFRLTVVEQTIVDRPLRDDAAEYYFTAYNLRVNGIYSRSTGALVRPPAKVEPDAYRPPGPAVADRGSHGPDRQRSPRDRARTVDKRRAGSGNSRTDLSGCGSGPAPTGGNHRRFTRRLFAASRLFYHICFDRDASSISRSLAAGNRGDRRPLPTRNTCHVLSRTWSNCGLPFSVPAGISRFRALIVPRVPGSPGQVAHVDFRVPRGSDRGGALVHSQCPERTAD